MAQQQDLSYDNDWDGLLDRRSDFESDSMGLCKYVTIGEIRKDRASSAIYCESIVNKIFKHLAEGRNKADACALSGISYETFCLWTDIYPEFDEGVSRSIALFKQDCEQNIIEAGKTRWQASAWMLERRFFDEYGQRQRSEAAVEEALNEVLMETLEDLKNVDIQLSKKFAEHIQKRIK